MKHILEILMAVILAAAAVSCRSLAEEEGYAVFRITEGSVAEQTKSRVSDFAELPLDPALYKLTLKYLKTGENVFEAGLETWDSSRKLAPGQYSAYLSCGDSEAEGPAAAWFEGTADLNIEPGKLSETTIEVALGSSIVKIAATPAFEAYYPQRSFIVSTPGNAQGFLWEGTPIFVNRQFSVRGTLFTGDGRSFELSAKTFKGEPSTCYSVTFDVTNVGSVTVEITFDDTPQTVDLGQVDINPHPDE